MMDKLLKERSYCQGPNDFCHELTWALHYLTLNFSREGTNRDFYVKVTLNFKWQIIKKKKG